MRRTQSMNCQNALSSRCTFGSSSRSLQLDKQSGIQEALTECPTPGKSTDLSNKHRCLVTSLDTALDPDEACDSQISPASVLPEPSRIPLKVLLAQSHSLQTQLDTQNPRQTNDYDKLRQQHAQLLAHNHILVEENNHRLLDNADLMSELMAAQQRAYQAERTSTTAVANATQLQGEVLRLSNQMDALREASEAQNIVVEAQQEELAHAQQQLADQQQHSLAQMKKKGWEAADWKAQALEASQKLAAANAQIADQARVIVAQEQQYAKDVDKLSMQLMSTSAAAGIQSFSPINFEEDTDDD